jgi:hypothetical protein
MRGIRGLFLDALKAQYANVPLEVKMKTPDRH